MKRLLVSTIIAGTLAVIGMSATSSTAASAEETLLLGSAILAGQADHAGIVVTLSGNSVSHTAKTDSGGNFSFSNVAPGTEYQLDASFGDDYVAARRSHVVIKPDGLSRVRTLALMARPGTVTGTVTLQGDSSRVGFTFEDLATGARLTQTDPSLNGVFTFNGVPAGKRLIRLFKPGFESRLILADVPPNGKVTLDPVELSSHVGSLDATFTLGGASVHDDIWVILEDSKRSLYYSGITDAKGRVKIEGMRAGSYHLLAKKANSEELIIDPVVIREGETTTLPNRTHAATTLTKLKGSISGDVQLYTIRSMDNGKIIHEKKPCYGCFVVTQGGSMTISDKDGHFLISGIKNGDYSVNVSYETCVTALHDNYSSRGFSITDASPAYHFKSPLPMYESTGELTGTAQLQGQTEHANIVVTVEGYTGYVTTTDVQGNYKLSSVPVRNKPVKVVFTKAGYAPVTLTDISVSKDTVIPLTKVKLTPLAK
ncbi:MAG: hypothetical protein RQ867_07285 [Mariprofundaceae bacterium]|nr:hypothetical protein [Mariprofundaceae bacterium]